MSEKKVLTLGGELSELDIFLSVNGVAINASGVDFTVYDAADTLAASGTAINIDVGKYTASGTVPTGFTLGEWHITWLILPVGGTLISATEHFDVQALSVAFGFSPPEEVITGVYDCVRIDIGDPEGKVFGDEFLRRVLIKAVRRLNNKLGLAPTMRGPIGVPGQFGGQRIRVIPITINLEDGTIEPAGDEYADLLCLQMEYIIATSEISALKRLSISGASGPFEISINSAVNDGVSVRNADGVSIEIGSARLQTRASLMRFHAEALEKELNDAVRRFLSRLTGNFAKMVW